MSTEKQMLDSAAHLLKVLLDPEADWKRRQAAGMHTAGVCGPADVRKRAEEKARALLVKIQAHSDVCAAEALAAALERAGDKLAYVTTRRMAPAAPLRYVVYLKDKTNPSGVMAQSGMFDVCDATRAVLDEHGKTARVGGRAGNCPDSDHGCGGRVQA